MLMKKIMILVAVVLLALTALTTSSLAGPQDFVLVNNLPFTIHSVYVSADYSSSWEEDVLGNRTLPPGSRITIRFPYSGGHCYWDIMIKDGDGRSWSWRGANLCLTEVATIYQRDDGVIMMNRR
jgi:hypothetical protein